MAAAAVACAHGPAAFAATQAAKRAPRSFSDVVDLTHPLFEGFPTYGGDKWFTMENVFQFSKDGLNIKRWTAVEHTGTHMDAPLHFTADGPSIADLPITDLVAPLAIVDISERAQDDADASLTPDDVKKWEAAHGPLPEGCCAVMNSGGISCCIRPSSLVMMPLGTTTRRVFMPRQRKC